MSSFLTVEDVNTARFSNQGFWWHMIDTSVIDPHGNLEYSNVKMDFCTIKKEASDSSRPNTYRYTVTVNATNFTGGFCFLDKNGMSMTGAIDPITDNVITVRYNKSYAPLKILLYMGNKEISDEPGYYDIGELRYHILNPVFNLNLKELSQSQTINIKRWGDGHETSTSLILTEGYTEIYYVNDKCGFVFVNLLKSDFKFECNQGLTVGKVNKVALGVDSEYKPSGAMVGNYNPKLTVYYGDEKLPVTYDSTLNDYVFDLDLTDKTTEGKIHFTVLVEGNEVLNETQTTVSLDSTYETINNLSKLTQLFSNGGTGRLGANITLTNDLTLTKDVLIVGNDKTLTCNGCKIIVPSAHTFKAESTLFTGGANTIQQNTGSTVELNECTFTNCTGLGSVIDCQVDIHSLDNPTDFTTTLNKCTFTNCDMILLHGGDLTVTQCEITGKIGNKDYPYFLYQTDGSAILTDNIFRLISNSQIESDIEFNSCIFTVGELASINGHGHAELSQNNITSFIDLQRNHSTLNITYLYEPIWEYIHLEASRGFCHSVSGVDNIYKTNVTVTRE